MHLIRVRTYKESFRSISTTRRANMARILSLAFVVILSVAHCIPIGEEKDGKMQSLSRRCQEENKLRPEDDEFLRPMKYVETTEQRVKCYLKCMLTGLNLMNEEGDLTLDDPSQHLKKHQNDFGPCRNVTGTDLCDKALNFHNCVWTQKNHTHTA